MTAEQFIDRYYRPDRLNREPGTRRRIIDDRESDLRRYGSTLITRHDSVTGRTEWLGRDKRKQGKRHTSYNGERTQ